MDLRFSLGFKAFFLLSFLLGFSIRLQSLDIWLVSHHCGKISFDFDLLEKDIDEEENSKPRGSYIYYIYNLNSQSFDHFWNLLLEIQQKFITFSLKILSLFGKLD